MKENLKMNYFTDMVHNITTRLLQNQMILLIKILIQCKSIGQNIKDNL